MDLLTAAQGLLGGLILNVMPCVFPVLFFKLNALIEHADSSQRAQRVDAVAYLLGTLLTFAAFAGVVIALRAAGRSLGWGMQMQNPAYVASIVALLFAFGLNAAGVFQLELSMGGGGRRTGWLASMVDGALVTLVSTPCSAPILGGATAAALAKDAAWYETLLLFWCIGVGLALPVLLVSFVPALNRRLPRPGPWMEGVKVAVAFTLFGAAIWFFESLQVQVTPESANGFLWFLLALGGALWLWQALKARLSGAFGRWAGQLALLGGVVAAALTLVRFEAPMEVQAAAPVAGASSVVGDRIVWTPFTAEVLAEARARGQVVFVDFTAKWCATCKVFERTHLNTSAVRAALAETNTLAVKADLTSYESDLWDVLAGLGRSGLPTYALYLPDGRHEVLPEGPPLGLAEKLRALSAR